VAVLEAGDYPEAAGLVRLPDFFVTAQDVLDFRIVLAAAAGLGWLELRRLWRV